MIDKARLSNILLLLKQKFYFIFSIFSFFIFSILSSKFLQLSLLYLFSIATYAKLLEIYLPKSSIKTFKVFPFLNYLKKNKTVSSFVNQTTISFLHIFFKYYNRHLYSRIPYIKTSKFVLYNINYLVVLDSMATLIFIWWQLFFPQGPSLLRVEAKFSKVSKPRYIEIILLLGVTFCYLTIFSYSYVTSISGKYPRFPIISESAVIWTLYGSRRRKLRFRY